MDIKDILDLFVEMAQVISALAPNETPALAAAIEKAKASKDEEEMANAKRSSH